MTDYKEILGALSVLLALSAYTLYIRDIFVHNTKPHAFSWIVWAVLGGIAFAAQQWGDAGAGSWVTFTDMFLCTLIFVIALWRGEKGYMQFDWITLALAGVALILWKLTETPTASVILIAFADFLGFLPTYRKSFHKPWEESMSMYVLITCKYTLALLAVSSYSIASALYVGALIPMNIVLVGIIVVRRSQLKKI